jgi:hypothetical protein
MDVIGGMAALCVLATFCMQSMLGLRAFAIASNVLFIAYGAQANLLPIVLLHAVLLPINSWSLGILWAGRRTASALGVMSAVLAIALLKELGPPEAAAAVMRWLRHLNSLSP